MSISEKRRRELASRTDEQIDDSDIPELDDAFWAEAKVVEPEGTQQITLRLKKSVLDAFKATGKGYHSRMNAGTESYARTLKRLIDSPPIIDPSQS